MNVVDDLLEQLIAMTSSAQPKLKTSSEPDVEAPPEEELHGISRISYRGYKALGFYDIPLHGINILTGTNNAGKSTALSALRILAAGLAVATRRKPTPMQTPDGKQLGYVVPTAGLAVSLENVHTNLDECDTTVTFSYTNGGELVLWFPNDGGCLLYAGANSAKAPRAPKTFREFFDTGIVHVPVLGPLEHDERLLNEDTVKAGATTHRACRHFRNYWHYFPDNFDHFAELLSSTWPGMTIERPKLQMTADGGRIHMFCREHRMTRELYWAGFGFQIWCQLLTHVSRATPTDLLVVDEPETYLHPIVQRRLLGVLRKTKAQVVLATHSASIVMEASDSEVIVIDKTKRVATRKANRAAALAAQLGLGVNEG